MKKVFLVYSRAQKYQSKRLSYELEQANDSQFDDVSLTEQKNHICVLKHEKDNNNPRWFKKHYWHKKVKKQIEESDIVIFIQAKNSASNDNIRWEIKTALSLEKPKPVAILQLGDYDLPKWLPENKPSKKYSWNDRFKLKDEIILLDTKDYEIFSKDLDVILYDRRQEILQQLFEQYKIYQQTSEELENRKQNVYNFYLTINTALLTFSGVIISWQDIEQLNKISILIVILAAGVSFNLYWCKQIERFKIINTAKLRLINSVERQLPLKLYDEEYKIMNNNLNGWTFKNSFPDEKTTPNNFIRLFIILVVVEILFSLLYKPIILPILSVIDQSILPILSGFYDLIHYTPPV